MKIELLENKTVKVVLSNADMLSFHLTYEEMDYKNPETKRVILLLIEEIKREVALDLSTGKLFIEAFPYADGGCILYVNLVDNNTKKNNLKEHKQGFSTPIIYAFPTINALGQVAKRIISRYDHIILKSSLFSENNQYFLLLYSYCKMENELSALLNEYGKYYGKGSVISSVIQEHGKELIQTDAIKILSECL